MGFNRDVLLDDGFKLMSFGFREDDNDDNDDDDAWMGSGSTWLEGLKLVYGRQDESD
jgi:hypothetical protein